jgi:A/G-specific adenine glycosylase
LMHKSLVRKYRAQLLAWYKENRRDLPWRRTVDPYRIWVSEVMLQQTRVDTVIDYFNRFVERFPDVHRLAAASQEEVLKAWEGLGYYARARNLHKAARRVDEMLNGEVPREKKAVSALPGVGEYIAAAVLSIAYQVALPVVDGNVKRVLARLFCMDAPANDSKSMKVFSAAAGELLDKEVPGTFNQAQMELGALVCLPSNPRCGDCPVKDLCAANKAEKQKEYPKILPRAATPTYDIAAGVVKKRGKILITKRAEEGLLGGLWEFPGGKVKPGESAQEACRREILEETGLLVNVGEPIATVRHAYTHFKIILHVFYCDFVSGKASLDGPVDFKWVRPEALSNYPFPKANLKVFPLLTGGVS